MDQLSDVLTAISHPTRRAIVGQLAQGPARFLDVARPHSTALNAVTKHLKLLERAGLIERRRQGREVMISFRGEPLRSVSGWVHEYERFWNGRLDQFEQYFREKQKGEEQMATATKTIEVRVERTISAPPSQVYDAWLDPKTPGTPWNMGGRTLLNPKVDGLFYMNATRAAHYGRFTEMERPERIAHTWVSPNTLGEESMLTVTFKKAETGTLLTLVHSGLPDTEGGRGHEKGWNRFLDIFPEQFGSASRREQ